MAERPESEGGEQPRRGLRLGTNVAIVAFGVFILSEALKMPFGSTESPGTGFWPVMISGAFLFLALLLLVTERDSRDYAAIRSSSGIVGLAVLSLGIFIFLFSRYGFVVPGFLLTVFWLRSLGAESWRLTIATSTLLVMSFYLLFVQILDVPFPEGLLAGLSGR